MNDLCDDFEFYGIDSPRGLTSFLMFKMGGCLNIFLFSSVSLAMHSKVVIPEFDSCDLAALDDE